MIVSLHTPKAGGSSFKVLLENHFKDQFLGDYSDFPINTDKKIRQKNAEVFKRKFQVYKKHVYTLKQVECIHGHFLPYKYSSLIDKPNVTFVTWLRDPLERLASHYYYWQRAYDKNKSGFLHKEVVENKWSFEKFCFSEDMRNIYDQSLWKFPIENFSFVGIVEHYDEDYRFFSESYLGLKNVEVPTRNVNPEKRVYFHDQKVIQELREFHSLDYEIYEVALAMRNKRINDKP